ncbi:di-heme oxidoredictase family protein [Azoarcus olearius]|nr:di-heme oxidoredictase family protein [Azoarcus olearius]
MRRAAVLVALVSGCMLAAPLQADLGAAERGRDAFSLPLPGLTALELERFARGRALFRQAWVIAPSRDSADDGLGPLYNRITCVACHTRNGRGRAPDGPDERMQSMLLRLSVPGRDPHGGPKPHPVYGEQLNEDGVPGVPGEGRAALSWREQVVTLADGERVSLRRPRIELREPGYGPPGRVLTSARVGPPVFGLGLLEAVPLATLAAIAREQRRDGVRGRLNRVWSVERQRSEAGRFGLKANQPDLRQQVAGAMIGDLGITSSLFPQQNCTPTQAACRAAPAGGTPELSDAQLDDLTFYFAHLAPPPRADRATPQVREGEALFASLGCATCHRPQLQTAPHPRYPQLSGRVIEPYTDLLVHDMGAGLADGRPDYAAGGRDWRTPPLWGIGLVETVNEHSQLLHDGRARNLTEAILWHGGEARPARDRFGRLERDRREALLAFLRSL